MNPGNKKMGEYEDIEPNFKEALMTKLHKNSPFYALLGMQLIDIKRGWVKICLPFDKKITQPFGTAHGGAIFSLADTAAALAMLGTIAKEKIYTTIEGKINYIEPFVSGEIIAEAKIISKRKRIILCEVEIINAEDNLIAKAFFSNMLLDSN